MTVHIKRDDALAWCDATLEPGFHFASVDAAVLNGVHDKNPRACANCTDAIIGYLIEGCENDNDDNVNTDIHKREDVT